MQKTLPKKEGFASVSVETEGFFRFLSEVVRSEVSPAKKGELQKYPCLLGTQGPRGDEARALPGIEPLDRRARSGAACAHDEHALAGGFEKSGLGIRMNRAVPGSRMHDPECAGRNGRLNEDAVVVDVRIHDVDAGEALDVVEKREVEGRIDRVALRGLREPLDASAGHHAEHPRIGTAEGGDVRRVRLRRFACGENRVVQDDENAATACGGVGGDAHGVEKIQGAVGGKGRRGAHGTDENDGLFALQNQIEEISRLFERVGAVRDDRARDVVARERRVDRTCEIDPDAARHRARVDVGNLTNFKSGDVFERGYRLQKVVDAKVLDAVARHLGGAFTGTYDGSAGSKECDVGLHGGVRSDPRQRDVGADFLRL